MSYILKQYNQNFINGESTQDTEVFMSFISNIEIGKKESSLDINVTSEENKNRIVFQDEYINLIDKKLEHGKSYYLHVKIKRMNSEQEFYTYLINKDSNVNLKANMQYINNFIVAEGSDEWVDFETIFTPLEDFDSIIFKLQRTDYDYLVEKRNPIFIYEELSEIKNLIGNVLDGQNYIKVGVQSHPGFTLCINGEEIMIGRTGFYEVRNGVITVDFIGVIKASSIIYPININNINFNNFNSLASSINTSISLINYPKKRSMDPFTIDYMYKQGE